MTNDFIVLCLVLSIFLFCAITYILDRRVKRVEQEFKSQYREIQEQALTEAFFSLRYNLEDYADVFEPMCLVLKELSLPYPKVRAVDRIGSITGKVRRLKRQSSHLYLLSSAYRNVQVMLTGQLWMRMAVHIGLLTSRLFPETAGYDVRQAARQSVFFPKPLMLPTGSTVLSSDPRRYLRLPWLTWNGNMDVKSRL